MALRAIVATTVLALAKSDINIQDVVLEAAREVVAWKQEKLPIPYAIEGENDVGYLGLLPINASFKADFKQWSLGTNREQEGFPPDVVIGLPVVKESGKPTTPPTVWRTKGPSAGGVSTVHLNGAVNPTAELTLMGWEQNVWQSIMAELDWRATRGASKPYVLVSSGDTLYGGCSEEELKLKYDAIIAAAGGTQTIVMGAEVSPFPLDLGWTYSLSDVLEKRRIDMLKDLAIPADWATKYANCTDGPCGDSMKYQYASGSFIMGPTKDLIEMMKDFPMYTSWSNRYFNEYYLKNLDKVALDYGGMLTVTLHNMNADGTPIQPLLSAGTTPKALLMQKALGQPVCFVQGTGNGFAKVKEMAESIVGHLSESS